MDQLLLQFACSIHQTIKHIQSLSKLRSSLRTFVVPMQRGSQFCTQYVPGVPCCWSSSVLLEVPPSFPLQIQAVLANKEMWALKKWIEHLKSSINFSTYPNRCQQLKAGHKRKDLSTPYSNTLHSCFQNVKLSLLKFKVLGQKQFGFVHSYPITVKIWYLASKVATAMVWSWSI